MKGIRIFVAGHRGMAGSAVCRRLVGEGAQLITIDRRDCDLCDQEATHRFLAKSNPDIAIIAAAQVGGILANSQFPVEFLVNNLKIAVNTIEGAYKAGIKRLLFLGSTCIYPRDAVQPIVEESLLTGPLEPTNEAYALAKITGLKLCQYYRKQYGVLFHSAMPTNLYGPGDNYHPSHSHVLPALLRRFHEAKQSNASEVAIWGTGKPRREFLHVDDLADALLHLLQIDNPPDWVNVGSGEEVSIFELAQLVAEVTGYQGKITCDVSKPDGTPRKLTDRTLLSSTGWWAKINLKAGLRSAYHAFLEELNAESIRHVGIASSSNPYPFTVGAN